MRFFGRRYVLTVDTIQITGLDVRAKVERSLKRSPNTAEITIYNLSADHRHQLASLDRVGVRLEAGYEDSIGLVFAGDLRSVKSVREGADWLTTISGDDGGEAVRGARVNVSHGPGATVEQVLRSAASALRVGLGNALTATLHGDLAGAGRVFTEGVVLSGPAADELQGLIASTGHEWSIQNGVLQVLPVGGALEGTAYRLTPETGLLGSPSVAKAKPGGALTLTAKSLMLPELAPGRLVVVDSSEVHGTFRADKIATNIDTAGDEWSMDIEGSVPA